MCSELRLNCDEVIKEWQQVGGFINCYEKNTAIFLEDETVYLDWLKEAKLEDTADNQKAFCKIALETCGAYSNDEIEKLMDF